MAASNFPRSLRLRLVFVLGALAAAEFIATTPLQAQSLSDLESRTSRFQSDAKELYRLDQDSLQLVWEAYCGSFDPGNREDREFAADIARQLQYKESDKAKYLVEEASKLTSLANDLIAKGQGGARSSLDQIQREQRNIQGLYDGVVLKGSNHPFVQYAMDYGVKMHNDMCSRNGGRPKVCQRYFGGISPDLVTVESGKLVIYEFKPNNSRAESRGWDQVKNYLREVASYYERFLPDGPSGATNGAPDSDHGGEDMLRALKNSPQAWYGKKLEPVPIVLKYDMCSKQF